MNKKAGFKIGTKTIFWMIGGFTLAIMALGLFILLSSYLTEAFEIPEPLIVSVLTYKFLNSPNCLSYQDPLTGNIDSGLIDINKFTNENLNNCYLTTTTKQYNFKFTLKNTQASIQTAEWYNVPKSTKTLPVRILKDDKIYTDELMIYVQKPI